MMACCILANPNAAGAPYGPPVAAFTPGDSTIGTFTSVNFEDTSTGIPTSWQWLINGSLFSTAQNPSYYFTTRGTFIIILLATNSYGTDSEQHTMTVI